MLPPAPWFQEDPRVLSQGVQPLPEPEAQHWLPVHLSKVKLRMDFPSADPDGISMASLHSAQGKGV